jgi:hypothetical protein
MRVVEMKKTTITRNQTMQEQTARQQQTEQHKLKPLDSLTTISENMNKKLTKRKDKTMK